jgi:hypothetical protein
VSPEGLFETGNRLVRIKRELEDVIPTRGLSADDRDNALPLAGVTGVDESRGGGFHRDP